MKPKNILKMICVFVVVIFTLEGCKDISADKVSANEEVSVNNEVGNIPDLLLDNDAFDYNDSISARELKDIAKAITKKTSFSYLDSEVKKVYWITGEKWFLNDELSSFRQILRQDFQYTVPYQNQKGFMKLGNEDGKIVYYGSAGGGESVSAIDFDTLTLDVIRQHVPKEVWQMRQYAISQWDQGIIIWYELDGKEYGVPFDAFVSTKNFEFLELVEAYRELEVSNDFFE